MDAFSEQIAVWVTRAIVLVIAFTCHELAHAYMADRFGDITPRMQGRLTWNPLKHLDPLGTLLLLFAGFGWAKPVEFNPAFLRQRSRYAILWVALAGPASNFLLALAGALLMRTGLFGYASNPGQFLPSLDYLLTEFIFINLILMVFNLLPIFPLDGEKIVVDLLPYRLQDSLQSIRPYGSLILLLLIVFSRSSGTGTNILSILVGRPAVALFELLVWWTPFATG